MKENDLSAVYQQIAELTGGKYSDEHGYSFLWFGNTKRFNLNTLDGLMSVWYEYCKGWQWDKKRNGDMCAGRIGYLVYVQSPTTGNFHADFARLLAAVLKECK